MEPAGGTIMLWILGGALVALMWLWAPTWRSLLRRCPTDARDAAAVFWAQHSSSHG
jgi:hypothetical protein